MINHTQYIKDSMEFFNQMMSGDGMGLSEEQKAQFKEELKKNGANESFEKLKEEISKIANRK